MTWTADDTTTPKKLTASCGNGDEAISIDIALANIGTTGQTWKTISATAPATGNTTNWKDGSAYYTFYYNDDVEEGDTTAKLVDKVTLSSATKKDAYLAFDFDLIVKMDSAQITKNEAGQEMTTPVESGGQFTGSGDAAPAYATGQKIDEIVNIEWNAGTTAP